MWAEGNRTENGLGPQALETPKSPRKEDGEEGHILSSVDGNRVCGWAKAQGEGKQTGHWLEYQSEGGRPDCVAGAVGKFEEQALLTTQTGA